MEPTRQTAAPPPTTAPPGRAPFVADRTIEVPMRLLGRTVKRTQQALATLGPGQVLAVHTNDP